MSSEQDMRRISETYRDIATETSPAHLDDRVRAMARQEVRTRYGLARAWIRPVAWAATIALSFAFILELTYFGDEPLPVDTAVPASDDSDAIDFAEPASEVPAVKPPTAPVVAAPEMKSSEMPALREAEERADEAAAGYSGEVPAAQSRRERASVEVADRADHCDAEDRQSADTWYRCVLALQERGLDDAAAAEFDALRKAFPDFREPVPE